MDYYLVLLVIFIALNLVASFINWLYYDLVVTTKLDSNDVERSKGFAILIITHAFLFISLGSVAIFGAIPLIGSVLSEFAQMIGFDKAISIEESFLINFCVFAGFFGIILLNRIIPITYSAVKSGFKKS